MKRSEEELFDLMLQMETLIRRKMMRNVHRNRSFMNPHRGQGRVLLLLNMNQMISQRDLGFLVNMSKQGLAELLAKLEQAGYIVRTPSDEDGRVMMVAITESGKRVADGIDVEESDSDSIFSCLNAEEQKNLKKYIEKIIENNMEDETYHHHRHRREFRR